MERIKQAYIINRRKQIMALLGGKEGLFNYHAAILERAQKAMVELVGELDAVLIICECELIIEDN